MTKRVIWVVAVIVTMIYGGLAVGWVHRNDNPTRTADQTGLKTYSPVSGFAQYSKITGERMSGFHHTYDDCMEAEQPNVVFPYRYECRRPKDPPTPIKEYE
jgi:hypothetical protein